MDATDFVMPLAAVSAKTLSSLRQRLISERSSDVIAVQKRVQLGSIILAVEILNHLLLRHGVDSIKEELQGIAAIIIRRLRAAAVFCPGSRLRWLSLGG
jgi:hypothetical protein